MTDADVTRTIDVLRQQRVQYEAADKAAEKEDQVNINFVGKIDDVAFEGGSAENTRSFWAGAHVAGFEAAVEGLKAGRHHALLICHSQKTTTVKTSRAKPHNSP